MLVALLDCSLRQRLSLCQSVSPGWDLGVEW